jgi:hypothetical protein
MIEKREEADLPPCIRFDTDDARDRPRGFVGAPIRGTSIRQTIHYLAFAGGYVHVIVYSSNSSCSVESGSIQASMLAIVAGGND